MTTGPTEPANLPRQLAQMTPAQIESVLMYLGSLSLTSLRARQALDDQQIKRAWALPDGKVRDTALANLQIDQELVAEAINRQQFPADPHRTIKLSRWL